MTVPAAQGLHGGLILKQSHHDLSAVGLLLAVDHHQIVRENAGPHHGLAPDLQGKMLAAESLGIKCQVVLNALLRQNGGTGGHISHHRDPVCPGAGLLRHRSAGRSREGDGPGLALRLDDHARLLQALQMKVDGGGGLQSHGRADLPHGGGIPVLRGEGLDEIIDLLLLWGEVSHGQAPSSRPAVAEHKASSVLTFGSIIAYPPAEGKRMFQIPAVFRIL